LRTSNPKIFAAGDACSRLQFTHAADAHARIVVQNALFAPTASTRKLRIPHCTYTQPEVARIGPHRGELDRDRTPYDVYRLRFAELDRGRAQGDDDGFVEILTEPGKDKILGGTIVGRDAGEQIAGICIAMSQGIGLGQFASTVLPYPTRAEYLRRLADAYNRGRLTPLVKSAFGKWFEWTA
jgi:pyruvate/2-oxoglutarate dehydrogenase complex dihydrolipoamide dehydrogenase (E3) component